MEHKDLLLLYLEREFLFLQLVVDMELIIQQHQLVLLQDLVVLVVALLVMEEHLLVLQVLQDKEILVVHR